MRLALGDFRDRVRRPVYAVTLLASVLLGYLAVPAADAHWTVVQLGAYRGVYNSAYVGTVTAMASAVWLMLGGFAVVRNTIARDERTGVGELLAATPLRTPAYLAAKLLSNVLVLTSMLAVLAATALVLQFARGESTSVDLGALLLPYAVIAFPAVVLTASAALFWELTPVLKSGAGNVIWFCCWMVLAIGGQSPGAPFGGLGVSAVVESLGATMIAHGLDVTGAEFSLGLTAVDTPLRPFEWTGFTPDGAFLLSRVVVMGLAVGFALLPVLWFTRFDPSRSAGPASTPDSFPAPATFGAPRTAVRRGSALTTFPRLLSGELRVLLQGVSRWWWAGAGVITAVTFVVPAPAVSAVLLPAAWIWPVLLWSRLGTQRHEFDVQALLAPYPALRPRVFAEWLAGVVLTAGVGGAAVLRLDTAGVVAWIAAALFIPSLAYFLGSLSHSHRLFQSLYVPLWYSAVSGLPATDYMGVQHGAGLPAPLVALAGATMFGAVLLFSGRRVR